MQLLVCLNADSIQLLWGFICFVYLLCFQAGLSLSALFRHLLSGTMTLLSIFFFSMIHLTQKFG